MSLPPGQQNARETWSLQGPIYVLRTGAGGTGARGVATTRAVVYACAAGASIWLGWRLETAAGIAVAFITPHPRKGRQPGLPPDGPELVGGQHLLGIIKAAQADLDLVAAAGKDRGAAMRTEMAPEIGVGFSHHRHRRFGEDGRGVKRGAMLAAAVLAVADADAVRFFAGGEPHRPAAASAGQIVHAQSSACCPRRG